MIRTEKTHLKTIAGTHAGMSGKNNEDSYGVSAFLLDEESSLPVLLAILADGIGGHNAGEVASALVVDTISQKISQSDGSDPLALLKDAVQTASIQVNQLSETASERKGMGSTVVCAWIIGKQLFTAYVGDSRIYLIRDEQIFRLTQDHSWIQEALDNGLLTPEQAAGHPNAHVIRRYVGSPEPAEVDFRLRLDLSETAEQSIANQGMSLKNGDQLLLCSDGLTDLVEDPEILTILSENALEAAVEKMIAMANQRGGHDNITTIVIKVPEGAFVEGKLPVVGKITSKQPKDKSSFPVRTIALGCLGILAVTLLIAAGFFGLKYLNRNDATATPLSTIEATGQPAFILESQQVTTTNTEVVDTPVTGSIQTGIPGNTLTAPGSTSSAEEGNLQPPPNPGEMTAAPTNTLAPTVTSTTTATPTASPIP